MNTRLQVRHPRDGVHHGWTLARQIEIAAGSAFKHIKQADVSGCATKWNARINTENPDTFMPSPGTITQYHQPGGPGIPVDSTCLTTTVCPPHYDSLIAKVIAYGENRSKPYSEWRGIEMVIDGIHTIHPSPAANH